jgi:glycerophosphoryl diester phosphodiesterase
VGLRHNRILAPGRRTWRRAGVALATAVMGATFVAAAPAQAMPGSQILGHRCQTKDPATTIENTVAAMRVVERVSGVACEIDTWKLADGTVIVWHDNTWGRVVDHSTLPAGVRPNSLVKNATWAQVRQMRTKGGEPIPTLQTMIAASAQYNVPLYVDIRNSIPNPGQMVRYANQVGATVNYYQPPGQTEQNLCRTAQIDRLRAAGATVGIKSISSPNCRVTLELLEDRNVSFITDLASKGTTTYIRQLRGIGVDFVAMGVADANAKAAISRGAVRVLVNQPLLAATW